jgi:precorrin isomerase
MAGWADAMPIGMHLKSVAADSSIGTPRHGFSIYDYCRVADITPYDAGGGERPIPIEEFIAYGCWFQQNLVPELEQQLVSQVSRRDGGFVVSLQTGEEFLARAVVVASGVAQFATMPERLTHESLSSLRAEGRIAHAAEHRDLSRFGGESIAVLGAGQSALETAVLLQEAGAYPHLIARRPQLQWIEAPVIGERGLIERIKLPTAPMGAGWPHLILSRYAGQFRHLPDSVRLEVVRRILCPSGAWWLRERFDDDIPVHLSSEVTDIAIDGSRLAVTFSGPAGSSPERLLVDRVIAATGYRVNVSRVAVLDDALRSSVRQLAGAPRLSAGFESSVPGLFFTGLSAAATFGPFMRFVVGSDFAGRRVAKGVRAYLGARS